MTNDEKEATLEYIEYLLNEMVEGLEKTGIIHGQPQVGAVNDAALEVLHEMERTLTDHIELVKEEQQPKLTK